MSKMSQLSECLVEKYGIPQAYAESFTAELFIIIRERLESDKIVKVKGLGAFKLTEVGARESVNVNTGERITLEGRNKLTFTPENAVRDRINAPFAQFESVDIDKDVDFSFIDEKYAFGENEVIHDVDAETGRVGAGESKGISEVSLKESDNDLKKKENFADDVDKTVNASEDDSSDMAEKAGKQLLDGDSHTSDSIRVEVTEPVKIEITDSQRLDGDAEQKESEPVVEELMRESVTHSRTIVHLLYGLVTIAALAFLAACGFFCYQIGLHAGERKHAERNSINHEKIHDKGDETKLGVCDTSVTYQHEEDTVICLVPDIQAQDSVSDDKEVVKEEKKHTNVPVLDSDHMKYNCDVRVRTGGYVILGLDTVITVEAGQTLPGGV